MLSKILKTISMAAIVATGLSAAIPEVEAAKKRAHTTDAP